MGINGNLLSRNGHETPFCPRNRPMDDVDFKILKILDKNCRTSNSEIARMMEISVRTVSNRIERLLADGVIEYFSLQFPYGLLGYRHYIGSMQLDPAIPRDQFIAGLKNVQEVSHVWEQLDGTMTFSFFSQDALHLEKILHDLTEAGAQLRGYEETRMHLPSEYPFSKLDWRVIHALFFDSRLNQKDLAETLGVSEKTIMRRLHRMDAMKLVQFTPSVSFEAIKGMVTGVLAISTYGLSKPVYLKIKRENRVRYWRNAGSVSPSIVLFLYADNLAEIYDTVLALQAWDEVKGCHLAFVVKNWENSTFIQDAILEQV